MPEVAHSSNTARGPLQTDQPNIVHNLAPKGQFVRICRNLTITMRSSRSIIRSITSIRSVRVPYD